MHLIHRLIWFSWSAALAGCSAFVQQPPQPGQAEADVVQRHGPPSARYAMPGGTTRLEYATGPHGRHTWMVDVDGGGRVITARQVLGEATFDEFLRRSARTVQPMTREELLRTLGRPGQRRGGGWQGGEVWSWRYPSHDCLWFQISIGDDGLVRDGAYGPDPACDSDRLKLGHRLP